MNRAERRSYIKQGASKETVDKLSGYNSPCTLAEAVQIARASAEDVMSDYQARTSTLQVAISLQLDIIKDTLIKAGIISEEEFMSIYKERVDEFNSMKDEYLGNTSAEMKMNSGDIDVKVEG